jgi:hypothetical protein
MNVVEVVINFSMAAHHDQQQYSGTNHCIATKQFTLDLTQEVLKMLTDGEVIIKTKIGEVCGKVRGSDVTKNPPHYNVTGQIPERTQACIQSLKGDGWKFNEKAVSHYIWL